MYHGRAILPTVGEKIETQRGIGGAHRRVHGRGGWYYTQLAAVLCWTWKRDKVEETAGRGHPGVTDEAKLAKQHTISPIYPAFSHHADDRPNRIPWLIDVAISSKATLLHPGHCVGGSESSIHLTIHPMHP